MKRKLAIAVCFLFVVSSACIGCKRKPADKEPEATAAVIQTEQPTAPEPAAPEPEANSPDTQASTGESATNGADDIDRQLEKVNDACEVYLAKNKETTTLLSLFSFLYDDTNQKYIDVKELKAQGCLRRDFANEDIMVLYMKPSEFASYNELNVTKGDELTVFCAVETGDTVRIRNYQEEGGTLPLSEFKKVVLSYNQVHGDIVTPEKDGPDYNAILKGVHDFENKSNTRKYSIRYMRQDGTYAVVVFSDEKNVSEVKEHILKKKNDVWEVVSGNLQDSESSRTEINAQYPDFDITMLPPYDLSKYRDKLSPDSDAIINAMLSSGLLIEKSDLPVTYCCRTDQFLYVTFESGKKFLGFFNKDGVWDFYPPKDYEEAVKYMLKLSGEKIVPAFIIPL